MWWSPERELGGRQLPPRAPGGGQSRSYFVYALASESRELTLGSQTTWNGVWPSTDQGWVKATRSNMAPSPSLRSGSG
jgi:hypothetical protein